MLQATQPLSMVFYESSNGNDMLAEMNSILFYFDPKQPDSICIMEGEELASSVYRDKASSRILYHHEKHYNLDEAEKTAFVLLNAVSVVRDVVENRLPPPQHSLAMEMMNGPGFHDDVMEKHQQYIEYLLATYFEIFNVEADFGHKSDSGCGTSFIESLKTMHQLLAVHAVGTESMVINTVQSDQAELDHAIGMVTGRDLE